MKVMKKRMFKKKYGVKLYYVVNDSCAGVACEIEFLSLKTGEVVGQWAYGWYDSNLPYQGQDYIKLGYMSGETL